VSNHFLTLDIYLAMYCVPLKIKFQFLLSGYWSRGDPLLCLMAPFLQSHDFT
jgi:hypothetical protein